MSFSNLMIIAICIVIGIITLPIMIYENAQYTKYSILSKSSWSKLTHDFYLSLSGALAILVAIGIGILYGKPTDAGITEILLTSVVSAIYIGVTYIYYIKDIAEDIGRFIYNKKKPHNMYSKPSFNIHRHKILEIFYKASYPTLYKNHGYKLSDSSTYTDDFYMNRISAKEFVEHINFSDHDFFTDEYFTENGFNWIVPHDKQDSFVEKCRFSDNYITHGKMLDLDRIIWNILKD